MNWLDIVLILLLAFSTLHSLRRGFSREIVGLAASIAALVLAMWFYGSAGSYLAPYVGSEQTARFMGFAVVMVIVLMAGAILGWILSRFVRTVGLSFFDRLLGAAFGLLKGVFVLMAILTAVMAFGPRRDGNKPPEPVLRSRIAPYIVEASHASVALAPMELKEAFHERYAELKSDLKEYARTRAADRAADKDSSNK
jgi:membrane protein required for colicin V production